MNVLINGAPVVLHHAATVADAVSSVGAPATGVAAAVNGEVLTRSAWAVTRLAEGDRIEILTAVQGG
ncbi:MAG TPA: sulfur carrier protein ThiS [Streptosporangiaceae bacterium]|nr:sulfur carrier protein ThiS [Streptosporangiaceae bacterium]